MYIVFTDFHHASLLNSLILLFEKRLGGEVYRPIGMDWHTKGYWKIYDHPETAQQFLGIGAATPDGSPRLNETIASTAMIIDGELKTFVYKCQDIEGEKWKSNKAITFDGFMNTYIDIVIASIPEHIEPFKKLCEIHPSKPKFIYQVGNNWSIQASSVPNVMVSAKVNIPSGVHGINYHQEFDTTVFNPSFDHVRSNTIRSFVNCFDIADIFKLDWLGFQQIEQAMPDWKFEALGGQCRDGAAHGSKELASLMHQSKFIWHTKTGGDGYGHIIHNAAACATPLIVRKSHYYDKLAEPLLIDGQTCIAIDGLNTDQIKNKIVHYSQADQWSKLSHGLYEAFKANADFDKEETQLRNFLKSLL